MPARKLLVIFCRLSWVTYVALIVVALSGRLPFGLGWIWVPAAVAIALTLEMSRQARARHAVRPPAVEVAAPVTGRWTALNSPADKVPSHGTHSLGQTYAVDIVAEPEPGGRPAFAWLWPVVRRNRAFPAFGEPLLAVADGTVVHATDRQRDHLSRTSLPALVYMTLIEAAVRELSGAGWITGNQLVLDLGDGTYAMYAHLQRGSLAVRPGDRVRAGQVLARCGNSGNSTEPHVHFQLMDHADLDLARGIPFRWHGIGVPANGDPFLAGEQTGEQAGEQTEGRTAGEGPTALG
ncbi:M23 family metallopeptidase [Streptomyces sp. NPDC126933]|uniref:M23 family metallopeptidase n=1 Tax=unclassified Streptomyces TaxID=2593676 RepID=UPI00364DA810